MDMGPRYIHKTGDQNVKKFADICAQGDVLIRRVESIPSTAVAVPPVDNQVIVTHSETGHHHAMTLDRPRAKKGLPAVEMFSSSDNPLIAWLRVNRPTALVHQRPHDTHEPILFGEGVYEVRRQREYTPEGWRRVAD